jgi:TPR repeat protein
VAAAQAAESKGFSVTVPARCATTKQLAGLAASGHAQPMTTCVRILAAIGIGLAIAIPSAAQAQRGEGAYRSGDYPRAAKSVGPAAERGNARAQAYLGFMYQYGRGVPQNYERAQYWYRRAAEQGNATGQKLLGLLLDKGLGTETNHIGAHVWLNLAAARTKGVEHEDNIRLRDAVASKMSLGQLADAQYLASTWFPKPER